MADMRIRDNSSGRIASGHLGRTQGQLGKTLEKLSSGYRINRSADDASGLAISETMRALITGLEQAEQNSEDGLSLVQVGEAALSEIHTVLNRIVELSTTSANGTYTDERDRAALQKELNQLYDEVERISKTANFNGIKLQTASQHFRKQRPRCRRLTRCSQAQKRARSASFTRKRMTR